MTAVARSRTSGRARAGNRSRPPRRHLGVVREDGVHPGSVLAGTFAGVGIVFVVAALFGLAIAHTMLAQGEDRLVEMEARLDVAAERNRELSAEVAALEAPDRVEQEAEGRLGMIRPEEVQWLVEIDPHTEFDAESLGALTIEPGAPSS
jgi:cell division protein FtsB